MQSPLEGIFSASCTRCHSEERLSLSELYELLSFKQYDQLARLLVAGQALGAKIRLIQYCRHCHPSHRGGMGELLFLIPPPSFK